MAVMNLEDIAKLAGVSRSTVSRVINNDPNVSAKSRARVQATIDEVGYRPNAAARALASHRSHAIGLVVPEDFSRYHVDNWYPLIIEATLAATRDAGQSLMLIMEDTFASGAGDRLITQFIDSGRVDGLLVLQHSYRDMLTPRLLEREVPFVLIAESDVSRASWVDNDNFTGGRMVGELLRRNGARNVTAFAGTEEHVPSRRRIDGLRSIFPDAEIVFTGHSIANAESACHPVLAGDFPDAVFAVNGWIAPALHRVSTEIGLAIPEEILLASFDDFDPEQGALLGLTTVVQHVPLLANRAVNLLIDRVEGRAPPGERIVLDCTMISRGSCNELADSPVQGGATLS